MVSNDKHVCYQQVGWAGHQPVGSEGRGGPGQRARPCSLQVPSRPDSPRSSRCFLAARGSLALASRWGGALGTAVSSGWGSAAPRSGLGEVAPLSSSWQYRCFLLRLWLHFSTWPRGVRLGSGLESGAGRGRQAPDSAPRCRPHWFRGPCRSTGWGSGPQHPALEPFSNLTDCIQV